MAEQLQKKKKIRAGHRGSVKRTLRQVEEAKTGPDLPRLSLLKMTLTEKLETLRALDNEIVDWTDDEEALAEEIEQSDTYKETIYAAMISIDKIITPAPVPTSPPTPVLRPAEGPTHAADGGPSARVKLPK